MATRRLDDEIARIDANRNYYPAAAAAQPFSASKKTFAPVSAPRPKDGSNNAMYAGNQQGGLPTYIPANYGSPYASNYASSLRNPKDPLPSPPVPQTADNQIPTGKPSFAYSHSVGADYSDEPPRDGQHVHHFTAETITKQYPTHPDPDAQNPPQPIYQKEIRVESYTKSPYPPGHEPPPPPPPPVPQSPRSPGVIYDVPSKLISASTMSSRKPETAPTHNKYSEFQAHHSPKQSPILSRAPLAQKARPVEQHTPEPTDECIYAAPNTPIYAAPDDRGFNTLPLHRIPTPPNQKYKTPPPAVAPKPYYTLDHPRNASRQPSVTRPGPQSVQRVSPPNVTAYPLYTATDGGYHLPAQAQAFTQQQPQQQNPTPYQSYGDDYYYQPSQRRGSHENAYQAHPNPNQPHPTPHQPHPHPNQPHPHHNQPHPNQPYQPQPPHNVYVHQPPEKQAFISERSESLRSYPMPKPAEQVSENDVDNLTRLLMQSMDNAGEPDFFGMCAKCGSRVVGENAGCSAMDRIYHLECFICTKCGKQLSGNPFFAVEGRPFCEPDYLDTLEKCSVCGRPITDRILRATGKPYHPQCFQCVVCGKGLDGIPFTVDASNQIHCIEDFHKKFAPRCHMCKLPIMPNPGEEQTVRIVAMDKSFHIECYKCEDCGLLLSSEADGRGCYPLDDHILCRACNTCHVQNITTNL